MHLLFRPLLLAACAAGLAACHSGSEPANQPPPTHPAAATPASPTAAPAATVSAPYWVLRGLLPGQADSLTLHLVAEPTPYAISGVSYYGSYYGPDGRPYELQDVSDTAPDSLILGEVGQQQGSNATAVPPVWRLKRQPNGSLTGTVAGHAIRLRPVAPPAGSLAFAVRSLTDSLAARPSEAYSPSAHITWQVLLPTGGPAGPRQALDRAILRDLRGDTTDAREPLPLETLYRQQQATYFKQYREDVADRPVPARPDDAGPYRASLNYQQQLSNRVLFQQDNLLSLSFYNFAFEGGIHGNYHSTVASYDLRTGRRLRYDDIFLPNATSKLAPLLEAAVRQQLALGPNKPLDEVLFVKQMPTTKNVFLTNGGVEFVYQPYEIAAYALGELRVFLPLGQVRPLLREGLPLPGAASVAAR